MATDPVDVSCRHCGRPVPERRSSEDADANASFCCSGCETVYRLIHDSGLDDYYRHRNRDAALDVPLPSPTEASYEEFDDPTFADKFISARPDGTSETDLALEGLHCSACVWLLERLPSRTPGLVELRVDLARSRAWVRWDPASRTLSSIAATLDRLGYRPHPYRRDEQEAHARKEDRQLLIRLAVSGAVAGNCMLIAFALYSGQFSGMDLEHERLFRFASLVIALPAVWIGGSVFFRGAWKALRAGTISIDLPISLGILTATAGGAWNTIRGGGEVYFDSVTALIFLLLVGRYIQRKQLRRAADARDLLHALYPRRAHRVIGGRPDGTALEDVPLDALQAEDIIEVHPGEVVPADGIAITGRTRLDRSLMTGESRPVALALGDEVQAGVTNLSGHLRLRVSATGRATRLGQLLERVESATRLRPTTVELADRIAGAFVAGVIALALVTLAYWWQRDATRAFDAVLAMLVVTCPCALGLATPLAFACALARAARSGLLIRSAVSIERLAHPGSIWLDKTGTLTEGNVRLSGWWGDESAKTQAAALERHTTHPIAAAFEAFDDPTIDVADIEEIAGRGRTGLIDGDVWAIGSPRLMRELGIDVDAARIDGVPIDAILDSIARAAGTPVVLSRNHQIVALASASDPVRPDASHSLDALREQGWELHLLSGDDAHVVDRVGAALGFDAAHRHAEVSPEEKEARLHAVDWPTGRPAPKPSPNVMVGDGVNDAAALATADVGIGVRGGAEAALSACDIYLQRGGVDDLPRLIGGSRRTMRVVKRNLIFSLAYNSVGASLAFFGIIGPLGAALLMPLSSLTVTLNSALSRTFDDGPTRSLVDRDARTTSSPARPVPAGGAQ